MMKPFDSIFLHYFDIHFMDSLPVYGSSRRQQLWRECDLATRFALLASNRVLIPAASFAESEICRQVLEPFKDLYWEGRVALICSEPDVGSFAELKLNQYSKESRQYSIYQALQDPDSLLPALVGRERSATADVSNAWVNEVEKDFSSMGSARGFMTGDLQKRCLRVPEFLDGLAFTPENAISILHIDPNQYALNSSIYSIVNSAYFESYSREHDASVVTDLVYLNSSICIWPENRMSLPYRIILNYAKKYKILDSIQCARAEDIELLEGSDSWVKCLTEALGAHAAMQAQIPQRERDVIMPGKLEVWTQAENEPMCFDVLVVTALQIEYEAFAAAMNKRTPYHESTNPPIVGYAGASDAGRGARVLLISLNGMGNNSAAARVSAILAAHPEIEYVLMTGIAGAVPNRMKGCEHVRLGDVVVSDSNGVVQYDIGKNTASGLEPRVPPRPASSTLLQHAHQLVAEKRLGDSNWIEGIPRIIEFVGVEWGRPSEESDVLHDDEEEVPHPDDDERIAGEPRVFFGQIASANVVQKDAGARDRLRDEYGVKAIEMEASGIAEASFVGEKPFFVVRGTCDYCDSYKNDDWQKYAAVIAAAFSWELVRRL